MAVRRATEFGKNVKKLHAETPPPAYVTVPDIKVSNAIIPLGAFLKRSSGGSFVPVPGPGVKARLPCVGHTVREDERP